MKVLNQLGVHAGNALYTIIGNMGNVNTYDSTRVSRRRFSNEDCCVEIGAVPVVQSRTSEFFEGREFAKVRPSPNNTETVLNHRIVKTFLTNVVSSGYIFHGIHRLPSERRNDVLRLEVALKVDVNKTAGGGPSIDDDDDDKDDPDDGSGPKFTRAVNNKQKLAKWKKEIKRKQKSAASKQKKPNKDDEAVTADDLFADAERAQAGVDQMEDNDDGVTPDDIFGGFEDDQMEDQDDGGTSQDIKRKEKALFDDSDDEEDPMFGP
jgi:hypothetical protein